MVNTAFNTSFNVTINTGLYPVYDYVSQVAGEFQGIRVVAPASLRHALSEAQRKFLVSKLGSMCI